MNMKRAALIKKINKVIPEAKAAPSEEFGWDKGAILFLGSDGGYVEETGAPIFDYYRICGWDVNPTLEEILEEAGWFAEPNDPGTLFAYN